MGNSKSSSKASKIWGFEVNSTVASLNINRFLKVLCRKHKMWITMLQTLKCKNIMHLIVKKRLNEFLQFGRKYHFFIIKNQIWNRFERIGLVGKINHNIEILNPISHGGWSWHLPANSNYQLSK